ncbi:MAG TPA: TetR/AcrR family transcriptional regulator [Clostridia bacterium]|nr:TetR/AcrR family transcriptional regulator [Clostridia bacterium]
MKKCDANLRQQILDAALKVFAERGYAGASIHDIVERTTGSKPSLYYYFESKEALYKALVDYALDECYALTQKAAARSQVLEEQFVEILQAQFEFLKEHRDLVRLAFSAAFASPGELPEGVAVSERGRRNFEFFHALIQAGLASGQLDKSFDSLTLAHGIYGALCFHLMVATIGHEITLDRQVAEQIVRLYFQGAREMTPQCCLSTATVQQEAVK